MFISAGLISSMMSSSSRQAIVAESGVHGAHHFHVSAAIMASNRSPATDAALANFMSRCHASIGSGWSPQWIYPATSSD
jgi:hypothetical protein